VIPNILSDLVQRLKVSLYKTGYPSEVLIARFRKKNGKFSQRTLGFSSTEAKDQFVNEIYQLIQSGDITELGLMYEAWTKRIPADDEEQLKRIHSEGVRNEPDRSEHWVFYYENQNGDKRMWLAPMTKVKHDSTVLGTFEKLPNEMVKPGRLSFFFEQAATLTTKEI